MDNLNSFDLHNSKLLKGSITLFIIIYFVIDDKNYIQMFKFSKIKLPKLQNHEYAIEFI
jgi:hypothetical protein